MLRLGGNKSQQKIWLRLGGKNKSRQKPTIQTKVDKSRQKTNKIMLRLGGKNKSRQKQTKIYKRRFKFLVQHLSAFVVFVDFYFCCLTSIKADKK